MVRRTLALVALGSLVACTRITDADVQAKLGVEVDTADSGTADTAADVDADGDGYTPAQGDCDDASGSASPGNTEVCDDGIDNDCDGTANGCALGDDLLAGAIQYDGSAAGGGGLGMALAAGGDVDGDGLADALVGAPLADTSTGAVYLVRGTRGPVSGTLRPWIGGSRTESDFGASVAILGDTDGDGVDDVLVGAPRASTDRVVTGAAYLFRGGRDVGDRTYGDGIALSGFVADGQAGRIVSAAGDLNGDTLADMLVTFEGERGATVAIVAGEARPGPLSLEDVPWRVLGGLGIQAATGVGDVDGDGFADFAVGHPSGNDGTGVVYVVYGRTGWLQSALLDEDRELIGEPGDSAGWALGGADVNGDGRSDVLVGAPTAPSNEETGAVYVVLGSTSRDRTMLAGAPRWYATASQAGPAAGAAVSSAGDTDGDGFEDVLVASYIHGQTAMYQGIAYLMPGSATIESDELGRHPTAEGRAGAYLGYAVAGGGDMNGNGTADLLIGAPGMGTGAVFLVPVPGL